MPDINFKVTGPIGIPCAKRKAAKVVDKYAFTDFWEEHADIASRQGCYVFAVRAAKGCRPYYVGKATKTFRQEVFASHKLALYHEALADRLKGTAVFYFVCAPERRGRPNKSAISEVEDFLIQTAVARNWDLLNIKGTKGARWSIGGVIRSGKGQRTKAASEFKKVMDL